MTRVFMFLVLLSMAACAGQKAADATAGLQPGRDVSVSTNDGSVIKGRVLETKPDAIVVQLADGGTATIARRQVREVSSQANRFAGSNVATGAGGSATRREAAPAFREVTVPAGTTLHLVLDNGVSSESSRVENPVAARVTTPIVVEGVTAIPGESSVHGVVTEARRSGKVKGRAAIGLRFDSLSIAGTGDRYDIRTAAVSRQAASTRRRDAVTIGAPAAGGAILGGILGGKKGALVGSAVGGGAGTAVVLSTRGKEVSLPRGSRLDLRLSEPVAVRVPIG